MADVFVSWSSGDAGIAQPLSRALRNAGFTVDEYSDDPKGGAIGQNVQGYVDSARLAVFVLSAQSVSKPWIQTEVSWCYHRQSQEKAANVPEPARLKMIPLLIGNVADAALPPLMQQDPLLRRFPVPAGSLSSRDELALKKTIRATLKMPAPIVVPAAFFAMTRAEAEDLFTAGTMNALVSSLCRKLGMDEFPALAQLLLTRYGQKAEEFAPFPGGTLKAIVEETIGDTNKSRREQNERPPLWIWWCTEALLDAGHPDNGEAVDLWERGPSIAIVDSISVLHDTIRQQFTDLPEPKQSITSALLWVPPYTLHTAELAALTESSVKALAKLRQKYRTWSSESGGAYLAFDIGTQPTLRRWVHQVFVNVELAPKPLANNVAAMAQMAQSGFRATKAFFTDSGGN